MVRLLRQHANREDTGKAMSGTRQKWLEQIQELRQAITQIAAERDELKIQAAHLRNTIAQKERKLNDIRSLLEQPE